LRLLISRRWCWRRGPPGDSRTREQTIHYSLHYVRLRLGPEPGEPHARYRRGSVTRDS
jgi:hypothetical protein